MIVGVAMGSAAPLISKAMRNSELSNFQITLLNDRIDKVVPNGVIVMWSGAVNNIPTGWRLCNGQNGTPDLRDRFVVGVGNNYSVGENGGANEVVLLETNMPSHNHSRGTLRIQGKIKSIDLNGENLFYIDEVKTSGALSLSPRKLAVNYGWLAGDGDGGVINEILFDTNNADSWDENGRTSSAGGNVAHENRPPYYALAYIMKVAN